MLSFKNASLTLLALAASGALTSPAVAHEASVRPGIYAPMSSENAPVYHNKQTFSCIGNGAAYCAGLQNNGKFTPEEQEMMDGSSVNGQIELSRDPDSGTYFASGSFYVLRACDISSSPAPEEITYANQFRPWWKPVECVADDDGAVMCPFYDSYDRDQSNPMLLVLRAGPDDTVTMTARAPQTEDPVFAPGCQSELEKAVYHYESRQDYDRNMFVSARLNFRLADANLNQAWKSLSDKDRKRLLPAQRAWIREKDKRCGAVTMKGDEKQMTEMYLCQTVKTLERTQDLN